MSTPSSAGVMLIGYLAGTSASGISLLPGGLGVVEPALILALVKGGVSTASATAGVLLCRVITLVLFTLVGWTISAGRWGFARARHQSGHDASAGDFAAQERMCGAPTRTVAMPYGQPKWLVSRKDFDGCGTQDRDGVGKSRPATSHRSSAR